MIRRGTKAWLAAAALGALSACSVPAPSTESQITTVRSAVTCGTQGSTSTRGGD
jgi:hypothetical protein